jgi:hypothetical protein
MSEAADPLTTIRVAQAEQAMSFRERVFNEALELLREDLRNPDQTGVQATYRANEVGLGLLEARLYGVAADLYERLVTEIEACIKPAEQVATCTLLHLNWGVALTLMRDYDRGIPHLMMFQEIAERTGTPYDKYVANVHLEDRFEGPALRILTRWADDVYRHAYRKRIDELLVKDCFSQLEDGRYMAFAAALATEQLWRSHYDRPTLYTSLALLRPLRTLVTALEVSAKRLAGLTGRATLRQCYYSLFETGVHSPSWWHVVTQNLGDTSYEDWEDFENKLHSLLSLGDRGDEGFYAKSLCITLLARNFVSHDLLPSPNLTGTDLFPHVKCYLAAAFVALHLAASDPKPPAEEKCSEQ